MKRISREHRASDCQLWSMSGRNESTSVHRARGLAFEAMPPHCANHGGDLHRDEKQPCHGPDAAPEQDSESHHANHHLNGAERPLVLFPHDRALLGHSGLEMRFTFRATTSSDAEAMTVYRSTSRITVRMRQLCFLR